MSLFQNLSVPCPACDEMVAFEVVSSVNADRRPDFREEILDGSFQREVCPSCHQQFRVDPQMTYLDQNRGQWITVYPFGSIGQHESLEQSARTAFQLSYGKGAAEAAQELGKSLTPRVVFGWAALREKLFAAEHGLDDIELELTKIATMRGVDSVPLTSRTELRLAGVDNGELIMVWVVAESGEVAETLGVPRDLYDEIAADDAGWAPLREELTGRMFVDVQRLMIAAA